MNTADASSDSNKSPAKKQTATKQAVDGHNGTRVIFYLYPELCPPEDAKSGVTIDGVDNDRFIDAYNEVRVKEPLVEEDVYSIILYGVRTPVEIFVRKEGDVREYVVDDGRQRIRRARRANELIELHNSGKKKLPAHIAAPERVLERVSVPCLPAERGSVKSEKDALLRSVIANSGKLHDSALAQARAATALTAAGCDFNEVANALAKDTQTVRDYLNIGNASSKVLKALDTGLISPHGACLYAQMPKDKQNEKLEEDLAKNGGKKVTREQAKVTANAHKAEAKGQVARQKDAKRTVKEMRLFELAFKHDLSEGEVKRGTKEHAMHIAALTTHHFILGEGHLTAKHDGVTEADEELSKEVFRNLFSSLGQGERLKKAAKTAPKAEE